MLASFVAEVVAGDIVKEYRQTARASLLSLAVESLLVSSVADMCRCRSASKTTQHHLY